MLCTSLQTPSYLLRIKKDPNSTGQNELTELAQISNGETYDTYLLDEWDANLDIKNRNIVDSFIDELALKSCVIEVLHRSHCN